MFPAKNLQNILTIKQHYLTTEVLHQEYTQLHTRDSTPGTDLEIATLVQRVGRSKESHLPTEQVIIIGQLHPEALDGLLLKTLVLQSQRAESAAARLRRTLCHPSHQLLSADAAVARTCHTS